MVQCPLCVVTSSTNVMTSSTNVVTSSKCCDVIRMTKRLVTKIIVQQLPIFKRDIFDSLRTQKCFDLNFNDQGKNIFVCLLSSFFQGDNDEGMSR